jgi:hypothetical protein
LPYLTLSEGKYYSPTIDVRGYSDVSFRFMSEVDNSTVTIQESPDGIAWTDVSTYIIPHNKLVYINYTVNGGFVRVIANTDMEVSLLTKE